MQSEWTTQMPEWLGLGLTSVMLLTLVVLIILNWTRSHLGYRTIVMESLRVSILIMIVITLLKPERLHREKLNRVPEVLILTDDTGSMKTKDVIQAGKEIMTRSAWLNNRVSEKFWEPLSERYKVHLEKLSTYENDSNDEDLPTGTNINKALEAASKNPNLRAVLILSDGDWNKGGSPSIAATQMRRKDMRIFSIAVGSDSFLPDLELADAKVPAFCLYKEKVAIPIRIQSRLNRDLKTKIVIKTDTGDIQEKEIFLPAGQQVNENFLWHARILGEHQLSISIPLESDEMNKDNNQKTFKISVRQELLKALVIDSRPRWEYRFLRNALSRDPGVYVSCLLMHPGMKRGGGLDYIQKFPSSKEEISEYDVIFLGDVGIGPDELSKKDAELIAGVVKQQGSGLVFLPGIRGRHASFKGTELEKMMPVELDTSKPKGISFTKESKFNLTARGSDHLLTMLASNGGANRNRALWKNLPGFYWNANVKKAKPGTDVLAVHSSVRNRWGRLPLLVTQSYGNGNILFMGTDSAWRWRRGVEDTYHYRFWGQVIRWMAHPRHLASKKGIRLFYTPENPQQGTEITLQATIFDKGGFPLSKGTASATIKNPDNTTDRITLIPTEGGWGVFKNSFKAKKAGLYTITIRSPEASRELTTQIQVGKVVLEKQGMPARFSSLKQTAVISKGAFGGISDLDKIVEQIKLLPKEDDIIRRFALWSRWWWGLLILGLFCLYWVLRKYWGLT